MLLVLMALTSMLFDVGKLGDFLNMVQSSTLVYPELITSFICVPMVTNALKYEKKSVGCKPEEGYSPLS